MEIDFGGIGNEYAVDRAAGVCTALGIHHGIVDLGGDIRLIGPHPGGTPWRIGVRHPSNTSESIAEIVLTGGLLPPVATMNASSRSTGNATVIS
jgi:FAD:protein FMN transferase